MMKQLVDFAKKLFRIQQRLDEHDAELERLRNENSSLRQAQIELRERDAMMLNLIERLADEVRHTQDVAAKERENLLLRLENAILKAGGSSPLTTGAPANQALSDE